MHNLQTICHQDKIALVIMKLVADKFNKFPDKYIKFNCTASNTMKLQGLFVPFARVGSGDPVRVLHLLHNKYTGYN